MGYWKNNNWLNYWDQKNIWTKSYLWKKNNEIFFKKTLDIFNYSENDKILDIGCGNGDFCEKVSNKVNQVYCLDTSREYIKICERRFANKKNVKVLKIDKNYTDLSFIKDSNFSIIIANSVVQYYKSQSEVVDLVKSVKSIASKDAQFLISDIEVINKKKSFLKLIYNSIINGYFFSLIKMGLNLILNKEYDNMSKQQPLLLIDINKLINELSSFVDEVRIIDKNLTTNVNRKHLLIKL
tara:strand:- start:2011 stop:2727 length:717 start_codon:yes stop_codon:yes gene_type:complete